jgi:hypothetical protein
MKTRYLDRNRKTAPTDDLWHGFPKDSQYRASGPPPRGNNLKSGNNFPGYNFDQVFLFLFCVKNARRHPAVANPTMLHQSSALAVCVGGATSGGDGPGELYLPQTNGQTGLLHDTNGYFIAYRADCPHAHAQRLRKLRGLPMSSGDGRLGSDLAADQPARRRGWFIDTTGAI